MCRFRNRHPAFDGTFELLDTLTDVRSSVTMSDRAMPSDGPGMETLKTAQDKSKFNGDFMKHMCGSNFSVTDSKVDWCAACAAKNQKKANRHCHRSRQLAALA